MILVMLRGDGKIACSLGAFHNQTFNIYTAWRAANGKGSVQSGSNIKGDTEYGTVTAMGEQLSFIVGDRYAGVFAHDRKKPYIHDDDGKKYPIDRSTFDVTAGRMLGGKSGRKKLCMGWGWANRYPYDCVKAPIAILEESVSMFPSAHHVFLYLAHLRIVQDDDPKFESLVEKLNKKVKPKEFVKSAKRRKRKKEGGFSF